MIGRTLGVVWIRLPALFAIAQRLWAIDADRRYPIINAAVQLGRSATHLGILGWETFWRYQDDQQRAMSGRGRNWPAPCRRIAPN
jgi:hypothetical protein